jgi:hypothetical protein
LDADYTGNVDPDLQAARDLEEFTARILGEDATAYLTRTYREYVKEHKRHPNFGDVGRRVYEDYEKSLISEARFFTASGVGFNAGYNGLAYKGAAIRPVGPGWHVRWRNL